MPSRKIKRKLLVALDPSKKGEVKVRELAEKVEENLKVKPKDGKDGEHGIGIDGLDGRDGKDGKAGRDGKDGKDAEQVDVKKIKSQVIKEILPKLPTGSGHANRNISVDGNSSTLSRYTDINLVGGDNIDISYEEDGNDAETDITITSQSSIGGLIAGGTAGSALFVNPASVIAEDNDNFFWDDTNNRLGIGTNSPNYDLEVKKERAGYVVIDAVNTSKSCVAGTGVYAINDAGHYIAIGIAGTNNSVFGSTQATGIYSQGYAELNISNEGNHPIIFKTDTNNGHFIGGTEKMRLAATGELGIGTNTPEREIDVVGDVRISNSLQVGSSSTYAAFYSEEGDVYSNDGKLYVGNGANTVAERYGVGYQLRENGLTKTLPYPGIDATFTAATATIEKTGQTFVSDGVVVGDFMVLTSGEDGSAVDYTGSCGEILSVEETKIIVSIAAAGTDVPNDLTGVGFVAYNHPIMAVLDNGDIHFKVGGSPDASFKVQSETGANDHTLHYDITPSVAGHNAIELDLDPNGYGGVSAMKVNYDATGFENGMLGTVHDVAIDNTGSSGGDVHVLDVAKSDTGDNDLEIEAVVTHPGVDPIAQYLGTAAALAAGFEGDQSGGPSYTDRTAAFDDAGTNVQIFDADNDFILLASATKWDEVNVLLATPASQSIAPTFHYIEDDGSWVAFTPSDDTNGFQQNGTIRFEQAGLTTWGVRTIAEVTGATGSDDLYWIKITRTRNNVPTPPTESTIKITAIGTKHVWDSQGRLSIKTFSQAAEPDTTDLPANKMCFWTDTDNSKLYLCYNHGGTIKTTELS